MLQSSAQAYLTISAAIFGIVAIMHLVRAGNRWAFVVGPITIPLSASWIGFAVTAALCLWGFRLAAV